MPQKSSEFCIGHETKPIGIGFLVLFSYKARRKRSLTPPTTTHHPPLQWSTSQNITELPPTLYCQHDLLYVWQGNNTTMGPLTLPYDNGKPYELFTAPPLHPLGYEESLINVSSHLPYFKYRILPSRQSLKESIRRYLVRIAMSSHMRCCSSRTVGEMNVLLMS